MNLPHSQGQSQTATEIVRIPSSFMKIWRMCINNIYFQLIVIAIVFLIVGQILSPGYAAINNIGFMLASASILAFASVGQTLIIASGGTGIDLSVSSVMTMGAILGISFSRGTSAGLLVSVVGLIVIGGAFGLINGIAIQRVNMPPIIMTLGISTVIDGFVNAYVNLKVPSDVPVLLHNFGIGYLFGPIRYITVIGVALVIVMALVFKYSNYAKNLFLVGSNRRASRLTGLSVDWVIISTYVLAGALGALAGLVMTANLGSAQIGMAKEYTLLTIAAVVIGGTKLSGGSGTFTGSALGSFVLVILYSLLIAVKIPEGARQMIQGTILLIILLAYSRDPKLRQ